MVQLGGKTRDRHALLPLVAYSTARTWSPAPQRGRPGAPSTSSSTASPPSALRSSPTWLPHPATTVSPPIPITSLSARQPMRRSGGSQPDRQAN